MSIGCEGVMRRRGSSGRGTHTQTGHGMGRERASLVRPAALSTVPREHLRARVHTLLP